MRCNYRNNWFACLEPMLWDKRSHHNEKPEHCNQRKLAESKQVPAQTKINLKRRKEANVNWCKPSHEPALGLQGPRGFQAGSCFQVTPVGISMPIPDPGGYRCCLAKLGSHAYSTLSTMIGEKRILKGKFPSRKGTEIEQVRVRQAETWDPFQQCLHSNTSSSDRLQRSYNGLEVTACMHNWGQLWAIGYKKSQNTAVASKVPGAKVGYHVIPAHGSSRVGRQLSHPSRVDPPTLSHPHPMLSVGWVYSPLALVFYQRFGMVGHV